MVTTVGTAGAGAVLIAAKYAAVVGIKTAVKAGLKEAERLIVSAAKRLDSDDTGAIDFFATSSRRSVPDSSVIVRGGVSELPPPGQTFSGAFGSSLDEAAAGVPHGQLVSTTAGDIRAGGGSVQHAPEFNENVGLVNNQHVDVTLGRNSAPFGELSANPVPKPGRFGGPDYPYSSWSD